MNAVTKALAKGGVSSASQGLASSSLAEEEDDQDGDPSSTHLLAARALREAMSGKDDASLSRALSAAIRVHTLSDDEDD